MTDISHILPFEAFVVIMLMTIFAIIWRYERKH